MPPEQLSENLAIDQELMGLPAHRLPSYTLVMAEMMANRGIAKSILNFKLQLDDGQYTTGGTLI